MCCSALFCCYILCFVLSSADCRKVYESSIDTPFPCGYDQSFRVPAVMTAEVTEESIECYPQGNAIKDKTCGTCIVSLPVSVGMGRVSLPCLCEGCLAELWQGPKRMKGERKSGAISLSVIETPLVFARTI